MYLKAKTLIKNSGVTSVHEPAVEGGNGSSRFKAGTAGALRTVTGELKDINMLKSRRS